MAQGALTHGPRYPGSYPMLSLHLKWVSKAASPACAAFTKRYSINVGFNYEQQTTTWPLHIDTSYIFQDKQLLMFSIHVCIITWQFSHWNYSTIWTCSFQFHPKRSLSQRNLPKVHQTNNHLLLFILFTFDFSKTPKILYSFTPMFDQSDFTENNYTKPSKKKNAPKAQRPKGGPILGSYLLVFLRRRSWALRAATEALLRAVRIPGGPGAVRCRFRRGLLGHLFGIQKASKRLDSWLDDLMMANVLLFFLWRGNVASSLSLSCLSFVVV